LPVTVTVLAGWLAGCIVAGSAAGCHRGWRWRPCRGGRGREGRGEPGRQRCARTVMASTWS